MSTDARRHTSIAAGEQPSRAGLAAAILSIRDLAYVSSASDQAQLASDMSSAGVGISATNPQITYRADSPGMHPGEYSEDGSVWIPFSGVMHFANDGARDTWTTANSAYLVQGDECVSNGIQQMWSGSAWVTNDTGWITPGLGSSWVVSGGLTPQYRRLNGIVFMRGRISGGTSATVFTLPAGFRPSQTLVTAVLDAASTTATDRLVINTDGTVVPVTTQTPNLVVSFAADA